MSEKKKDLKAFLSKQSKKGKKPAAAAADPEKPAEETKVNGTNGHSAAEDDFDGEDVKEGGKVNGHDESKESGSGTSVKSYVSLVSPTGFVPPSSFADTGDEGDECG